MINTTNTTNTTVFKFSFIFLVAIVSLSSCSKEKSESMGYDENYIDLIEHDSIFIGDWRTARGDDDYYVHFNINSSGTSKYQYDMKHDDRPPLII